MATRNNRRTPRTIPLRGELTEERLKNQPHGSLLLSASEPVYALVAQRGMELYDLFRLFRAAIVAGNPGNGMALASWHGWFYAGQETPLYTYTLFWEDGNPRSTVILLTTEVGPDGTPKAGVGTQPR